MAEYVNFSAEADDDDDDEELEKKSSKSEKKASIFGASVLKSSETATNKEQPKKAEGLDKLLAELSFAKKAEASKTAEADEAGSDIEVGEPQPVEVDVESAQEATMQSAEQSDESELELSEETIEDSINDAVELEMSPAESGDEDEPVIAGSIFSRTSPSSSTPPPKPSPAPTASTTPSPPSTQSTAVPVPTMPLAEKAAMYSASTTSAAEASSRSTSNSEAISEKQVEEAADDAWSYGRQKGRQEGVLAGALLGGGIEHFRHKRRERKMEKEFGKKEKAHEKDLENLTYEQKREAMVKDLREAYEQKYQNKPEASVQSVAGARPEAMPSAAQTAKVEQTKTITPEEVIEVPKDHHIEQSAWLSVEVDEHGNPLENSSFEYGAEYYRERAHEIRTEDNGDDESPAKKENSLSQPEQHAQQSASAIFAGGALTNTPPASVAQQIPSSTSPSASAPKRVIHAVTSPPTTQAGTVAWSIALVVILGVIVIIIL